MTALSCAVGKAVLELIDKENLQENYLNMGLLVGKGGYYGNTLRIKPPMCIHDKDVDFMLDVLEAAIEKVMK
ncbi:MAG: hypothetical protein GY850_32805 [bacterium]|nr:hypothetical protein [bacterium]